jgi:hypothetical protein
VRDDGVLGAAVVVHPDDAAEAPPLLEEVEGLFGIKECKTEEW